VFTNRPTEWSRLPLTLTTSEVCNLLLCGAETVVKLHKAGKLQGIRNGKSYVFDRESVRNYLTGAAVPADNEIAKKALEIIRQYGAEMLALYRSIEREEQPQ
jgi:excisionase family DNA binding protein